MGTQHHQHITTELDKVYYVKIGYNMQILHLEGKQKFRSFLK